MIIRMLGIDSRSYKKFQSFYCPGLALVLPLAIVIATNHLGERDFVRGGSCILVAALSVCWLSYSLQKILKTRLPLFSKIILFIIVTVAAWLVLLQADTATITQAFHVFVVASFLSLAALFYVSSTDSTKSDPAGWRSASRVALVCASLFGASCVVTNLPWFYLAILYILLEVLVFERRVKSKNR